MSALRFADLLTMLNVDKSWREDKYYSAAGVLQGILWWPRELAVPVVVATIENNRRSSHSALFAAIQAPYFWTPVSKKRWSNRDGVLRKRGATTRAKIWCHSLGRRRREGQCQHCASLIF